VLWKRTNKEQIRLQKKAPMRLCVVCRQSKEKKDLIRIVKAEDGKLLVDETGRMPGRGAYLCAEDDCIDKAYHTKVLMKSLRTGLDEDSYAALKRIVARRAL